MKRKAKRQVARSRRTKVSRRGKAAPSRRTKKKAPSRRGRAQRVEVEEFEEFELTATTKGHTPRRRR